ncbi:MAG: AarF/ABC1/UbiB kinase family protein, partial [Euryarchaeota archaeon]|nr:AarF/ABC1/UbiB kinase family protein [Euryarchaeota archaeon]
LRELDYIIEGRSADKFRKLFAKDPWIHIPRVYWEHTSKRVLTLEFIDGVKIDQTDELIKMGCNRRTISINSVRAFMKQIFEGGFFHADPHPANVFIMKNNVIALLDFGMVGSAPKETLDAFTDVLLATLARDVDRIMERMLEIYKPSKYTNLPQLRADLQDFVDRAFDVDGHLAVNQLGIGSFMDEIMFRFAKHRLEVPSEMIYLGKVMMYAEGTGKMLDPTFDIVSVVQPYIQRYAADQVQRRLDPFGFRNPAKLLQNIFEFTSDVSDLVRALPKSANVILTRIEKGELKVQFESQEMDQWNHSMGRVLHHQMALTALIAILILVFVFVTVRGGKLF